MMTSPACPSREELSVYIVGKLHTERSEEIDMHLQACPDCQESLETISAKSDTLLSGLHRSREPGEYLDEPQCQAAMARVQAIGCDPSLTAREQLAAASGEIDFPRQIGPYRLLAKLGQGGMGTVYKALHTKLDRVVALKLLPEERMREPAAVARFEREMKAVGKLDHPNIVRASDADEENGFHYLVMEYVDGIDLSELTRRVGKLPIADACELIRQAAVGLQHAHEHGLVHRDIKPSNLMLSSPSPRMGEGRGEGAASVKILDLGLALLADNIDQRELTTSGQTMGTLDYMAPEQGGDSHTVDIRADIYSLGATLYKLLTGEPIFAGANYQKPLQKLRALAMETAPSIQSRRGEIPDQLAAVVARMVARDPKDRYAAPAAVAAALAPFCANADLARLAADAHSSPVAPRQESSIGNGGNDALDDGQFSGSAAHLSRSERATATLPNLSAPDADTDRSSPQPPLVAPALPKGPPRNTVLLTLGSVAAVLAALVIYWQTSQGTVRIEINDDSIVAQIDAQGVEIRQGDNRTIRVEPGEHGLRIKHGDLEFQTDEFVLAKGGKVELKIVLLAGQLKVTRNREPLGVSPVAGQTAALQLPADSKTFTNTLGMEFALVPKGKAWLGGSGGNPGDKEVEFKDDFYLGVYEVTQEEWEKVMGTNPSHFSRSGKGQDDVKNISAADLKRFPLEGASGKDCRRFVIRLNEMLREGGWVYRLPTEEEWEYACRGGPGATRQDSGFDYYLDAPTDTLLSERANLNKALMRTCKVGSYPANRLSLHDLHGNVWELCDDAQPNPTKQASRGGCWDNVPTDCRAVSRHKFTPNPGNHAFGLRLARVPISRKGEVAAPAADGFVPLFNGKDLTGWEIQNRANDPGAWQVDEGVLISGGPANWLVTQLDNFENFHWRAEVMVNWNGNTGLLFRLEESRGRYQAEMTIHDDPLHPVKTGSLIGAGPFDRSIRENLVKPDQWFTHEVIAEDNHIIIKVNGKITVDVRDEGRKYLRGRLGLEHSGPGTTARFRNIELKELPPTAAAPDPAGTSSDYDKLATGRWTPVLTGPGKTIEPRNAVFIEGRIEIQNGHAYDKSIQAADLIVRAKVQKLKGQHVQLTLRDVLGVYYFGVYQFDDVERFGIGTRDARFRSSVKQHFEGTVGVEEGEFFELAFAAIGDTLTVYANSKRIGEIRDSAIARAGGVAVHATKGKGVFKDVEVMVLDKPAP